jgi:hypothetical protein
MTPYEEEWWSKDKVAKMLGMFSSKRLYDHWKVAELDEHKRKKAGWADFVSKMQIYYRPTENLTLKNYQFRALTQADNEAFPAFCNRVSKEAKYCNFKCDHESCTAESTAIRDQIIIGTTHDKIREALKNAWDLQKLHREDMQIESAIKGVDELSGENPINKMGKYSYRNMSKKPQGKPKACYYCGQEIKASVVEHVKKCRARTSKCNFCNAVGHYESVCRRKKAIKELKADDPDKSQQDDVYKINIFRITNFSGLGKLRNHRVKLHVDTSVKPVATPPHKAGALSS